MTGRGASFHLLPEGEEERRCGFCTLNQAAIWSLVPPVDNFDFSWPQTGFSRCTKSGHGA